MDNPFLNHDIFDLEIHFNPEGWGPVSGEKSVAFEEVPYAHFDKKDRCNRPADFAQGPQQHQQHHHQRQYGSRFC